jgi:hypothetical protein
VPRPARALIWGSSTVAIPGGDEPCLSRAVYLCDVSCGALDWAQEAADRQSRGVDWVVSRQFCVSLIHSLHTPHRVDTSYFVQAGHVVPLAHFAASRPNAPPSCPICSGPRRPQPDRLHSNSQPPPLFNIPHRHVDAHTPQRIVRHDLPCFQPRFAIIIGLS